MASIYIFKGDLTLGGFIAISQYYTNAVEALNRYNQVKLEMAWRIPCIEKAIELLDIPLETEEKKLPNIHITQGKIEYENVSFFYNEENPVLNDVNLSIKPGERISLVGKSGAGKSTIANLLVRFYDVNSGEIKIDGVNINQCNARSIRKNIGIVQQDVLIFDGSIRDNLELAKHNATDAEIWQACERAHAADFIKELTNGLDTVLGNGGISLSGGQKQRIAIARVFLKNPKILIFDEATSALDYEGYV